MRVARFSLRRADGGGATMEAIVLAGGLGTRLRSRVADRPKPMAEVAGKPFLAWLLDYLALQGVTDVILSIGYRGEVIADYFGERHGPLAVRYAVEDEPLGTGGAIRHALAESRRDPVWVVNGDTMLCLDYRAMAARPRGAGAAMTMALRRVPDAARYGAVGLSGDRVSGFAATGKSGPGLINSGVYLLSQDLFLGHDLPTKFSFERDFLPLAVRRGLVAAFVTDAWFIDIGIPEDYDRAQSEIPVQLQGGGRG
jgi:D-glycero-alpha-D-manno-heptose 1-phosphate guanylyltransferase